MLTTGGQIILAAALGGTTATGYYAYKQMKQQASANEIGQLVCMQAKTHAEELEKVFTAFNHHLGEQEASGIMLHFLLKKIATDKDQFEIMAQHRDLDELFVRDQ